MALTWKKKFEIGDQTIDMQHKKLVETYNALVSACNSGRGRKKLEGTLDFLCEYTVQHFHDEEILMRQLDYPEFLKHKELHDDFKTTATNLATRFKEEGPSIAVLVALNTDVGEWLVKHIVDEDKKIESYIKN